MGILRKTGDQGKSDLFSGERISKSSPRLETLGDLDELNAVLGVARAHTQTSSAQNMLMEIQKDLFRVGSEIATTKKSLSKLEQRIDNHALASLETKVQNLYKKTSLPKNFIIPGNTTSGAYLNHARTLVRRVERRAVKLYEQKEITNKFLLAWLNRLSVYLYLLTLQEEQKPLQIRKSRQNKKR